MEPGFACSKARLVDDGVPHLRPFNIGRDGQLDLSEVYKIPASDIPRGKDILAHNEILFNNTNSDGLVGKSALVEAETRIVVDQARALPAFVAYALDRLWQVGHFRRICTRWVSQSAVGIKALADVEIPLPSLSRQRRIVDILDRAASIRRLRRQAQETARQIIPALFVKMFGDPAMNPMGWPAEKLGGLVRFVSGGTPSKGIPQYWGGKIPWVSAKDLKLDPIATSEDTITQEGQISARLHLIPSGTVLILIRGMTLVHTVPVRLSAIPLTIDQDIKALIPLGPVEGVWLRWCLQCLHSTLLSIVSSAAHGTRKIELDRLMSVRIPLVPLSAQKSFLKTVNRVMQFDKLQIASETAARLAVDAMGAYLLSS